MEASWVGSNLPQSPHSLATIYTALICLTKFICSLLNMVAFSVVMVLKILLAVGLGSFGFAFDGCLDKHIIN